MNKWSLDNNYIPNAILSLESTVQSCMQCLPQCNVLSQTVQMWWTDVNDDQYSTL